MNWSLLDILPEGERLEILDVGAAFNGNPPYQELIDAGRARLTAFEPDQGECDRLNQLYGEHHRILPYFAGDGNPATFHETNRSLTGSLYEPNTNLLEKFQNLAVLTTPVAKHDVETVRIDDIQEIDRVDYFKLDIQGGELTVLQNAQQALISTLLIEVEVEFVPLYKDQPMFADVDSFLRSIGFQFHSFNSMGGRSFKPMAPGGNINAPFRQLLWTDALYISDWMTLERLSEAELRRYAVLAHDILGSFDLAHFILAELDTRTGEAMATLYRMMHTEQSP
jgi:FkbM family methyltransferase